jgi:catechol 2,3-dioxygenase-like lactoylglutathione lyase family enzyme
MANSGVGQVVTAYRSLKKTRGLSMNSGEESIGLTFSHMGVTVTDMPVMEAFYQKVMGFIVTDRGHDGGMDLVFLSRSPNDHHQIILSTGRPRGLPQNMFNPQFGASINQISFKMRELADMRKIEKRLQQEGATSLVAANHGNAWSLYAHDPEQNNLEFYVETPWYVVLTVGFEQAGSSDLRGDITCMRNKQRFRAHRAVASPHERKDGRPMRASAKNASVMSCSIVSNGLRRT